MAIVILENESTRLPYLTDRVRAKQTDLTDNAEMLPNQTSFKETSLNRGHNVFDHVKISLELLKKRVFEVPGPQE